MSFLELRGVTKRYGSVVALDAVDLAIPKGGRTAIVGPSGSGKSTLLRLIAGFEPPDAGTIVLGGAVMANGPDFVPAHRRSVGVVAQDGALFPHLTIADNIGFGLDKRAAGRDQRIADLMAMVELDPALAARKPDQLSGGQQQRVALARAMARQPQVMLLDEPFSALDTALRASTRRVVSDLLAAAGVTVILVTHDQAEALSFADQVAVMRDGKLSQIGAPRELYLRPKDRMIAEFLGEAIFLPAQVSGGVASCALGLLPVDRDQAGAGEIMLRPEQLSIVLAQDGDGPRAEVLEVDFGGAVCTLTLRLIRNCLGPETQGPEPRLLLRASCLDAPAPGAVVKIAIAGTAHLLT